MASFDKPANALIIVESRATWYADIGPWSLADDWGDGGNAFAFWHNRGGNWIFVDGHAKWLRPEQTIPDLQEECMWAHSSAWPHKEHVQWRDKRAAAYR
jgi:prepilin-type processing-associated H-X9-DG protein